MPRYFFHVDDGHSYRDEVGVDLPDADAARREAMVFAGGLIRDAGLLGKVADDWCVQILDASWLTLFRMKFVVAVPAAT